jgi:hypothetical protein
MPALLLSRARQLGATREWLRPPCKARQPAVHPFQPASGPCQHPNTTGGWWLKVWLTLNRTQPSHKGCNTRTHMKGAHAPTLHTLLIIQLRPLVHQLPPRAPGQGAQPSTSTTAPAPALHLGRALHTAQLQCWLALAARQGNQRSVGLRTSQPQTAPEPQHLGAIAVAASCT